MIPSLPEEDEWFQRHADRAAVFITLLGFLTRLWAASGTFLNPDEALHFRQRAVVDLLLDPASGRRYCRAEFADKCL